MSAMTMERPSCRATWTASWCAARAWRPWTLTTGLSCDARPPEHLRRARARSAPRGPVASPGCLQVLGDRGGTVVLPVAGRDGPARGRYGQTLGPAFAPVRAPGARPGHPDRDCGAVPAPLLDRGPAGARAAAGGPARPGARPPCAVHRAAGTPHPAQRRIRMLRTAMGPEIAAALEDPEVAEVLLNPDGSLWVDRLGSGRCPTGHHMPAPVAERIIRLVAAHVRAEVHPGAPLLSAELPETGERFMGALPPVVRAPSFAIRKRALRILGLVDYVADGVMTEAQAGFLRQAVHERQNIVVAGGTSTGKTTLANALLDEIAHTRDRVLILEDTVELQCRSDNHVGMRAEPGVDR